MRQLFMQSDLDPVIAGADEAGWVSGSCIGVPPSTNTRIVFDLGPDWAEFQRIQMNVYLPTGGSTSIAAQPSGAPFPDYNSAGRLIFAMTAAASNGSYLAVAVIGKSRTATLLPFGRFVTCLFSNTDATLATVAGTKITLQAFQY